MTGSRRAVKLVEGVNAIGGRPAGWKSVPGTGEYELVLDHLLDVDAPRRRRGRAAIESVGDLERRTREAGGPSPTPAERSRYGRGFFGQEQSPGRVRGAQIAAAKWRARCEARMVTTLHANREQIQRQGCRELVSETIERTKNGPSVRVRCTVTGVESLHDAWLWATGRGSSCRKCNWVTRRKAQQ